MNPLRELSALLRSARTDGERSGCRAYMLENAAPIALALGWAEGAFLEALEIEPDDSRLCRKVLATVKAAGQARRAAGVDAKRRAATEAAGAIGAAAVWAVSEFESTRGLGRAFVDPVALLGRCLTVAGDVLRFEHDQLTRSKLKRAGGVCIPMALLLRAAALKKQWSACWVDDRGLHFRWTNPSGTTGGLTFVHEENRYWRDPATCVTVPLAAGAPDEAVRLVNCGGLRPVALEARAANGAP